VRSFTETWNAPYKNQFERVSAYDIDNNKTSSAKTTLTSTSLLVVLLDTDQKLTSPSM